MAIFNGIATHSRRIAPYPQYLPSCTPRNRKIGGNYSGKGRRASFTNALNRRMASNTDLNLGAMFDDETHEALSPSSTTSVMQMKQEDIPGNEGMDMVVENMNENTGLEEFIEDPHENMGNGQIEGLADMFDENSSVHQSTLTETLSNERNERIEWKKKDQEYEKTIQKLHQRLAGKYESQPDLTIEVVNRINHLERENQRLQSKVTECEEKSEKYERDNIVLYNENTDKTKKLKGAKKKIVKAKSIVGKEEEKAKTAVNDKNNRLTSERKMRKERNEALASFEEQKKICEDLRAQLTVEQAGHPHLREDGTEEDHTTVVIPIEFKIHRGDFRTLGMVFESNQMKIKDAWKIWYKELKKPGSGGAMAAGPTYENAWNENKIKFRTEIEGSSNDLEAEGSFPVTGAEHDGWRSKRSLDSICRQAQASHNN